MAPRLRLSVKKKVLSVKCNVEAVFAEYGAESRNGGRGPMHTSPSGEHAAARASVAAAKPLRVGLQSVNKPFLYSD